MQDDIIPPNRRGMQPGPKRTMRTMRLRGHNPAPSKNQVGVGPPAAEIEAPIVIDEARLEQAKAKRHRLSGWWHNLTKKQKILFSGGAGLVTAVLIAGGLILLPHKKPQPAQPVVVKSEPVQAAKPTTVASPLTGMQVQPELAKRPVTGIMIENSLDARPQSGLQDAGIVFEAIAEGGITRFIGLFQESQPQYVGPVRSLRPYYIDFASSFQASIAHVGGSPEALAQIRSGGKDLDQFFNSGSYWRSSARYAPHNVYTSFEKLDALNKAKGYTSSQFTPWTRKEDKPADTPTAAHINVNISGPLYNSHYDYDKASNSYMRSENGKPHIITTSEIDKAGQQLHPKVVLTLAMNYSVIDSAGHSGYGATGSGTMYVFQDGAATQGTWSKSGRNAQFEFKDSAGNPITLNTGQAWVAIVPSLSAVASTP